MRNYYLSIDGQQAGPYTMEQLQELLAQGQITNDCPAWYEGLADWAPLGTLLEPVAPPATPSRPATGASGPALIASGMVKVDGKGAPGKILFTESTFFAFRSAPTPPYAVLFGAVGALIHVWISAKAAEKATPAHFSHPEIAGLDARTKKMLATSVLVCSFPITDGFTVKPSAMGFSFATAGHPEVQYKGLIFKKRIVAYLKQRGISSGR